MAQEYEAMDGVTSVKAAYDFRVGDPEVALGHLDLIHSMMTNESMVIDGRQPEIVLVFIGPSVNLVSTDIMGAAAGEMEAIAEKISAMEEDGVKFEICMTSAHAMEISPDSLLPELEQVGNGWISLIGYQHNGYAMIADF
jgi:intracellular sulfur oxidation DsrE/DsrF family protein